ncbi:MAG: ribulose-phosphate 3-epimerase [Bacilli bacterium]|jgi:ribulose-phosphate 3-epimerase|nr:ribulose-phosphate 3-epimerase [Bacillota bacterium]NLI51976.1 ribulose-phosphate 3-epimerase [Erysipelotrichaceae bacterium]OQC50524.1 MAG: Ribulose-phosphate 3-epimerase [Tenericutes bacterium ADurb.Bin024]HOA11467.1 ribulose-phosphate 3-epimerase [Bacilli bacterium]TAH58797.1 MAG: ribulose-phosphate 3-epimerase [Bacillota bacterium]
MKQKVYVAPSLLAADFKNLHRELLILQQNKVKYLHFDVMDGHFVPNLSFGIPILEALKPHYKFIYDVHLMVTNPEFIAPKFVEAGADIVTFHLEAMKTGNDVVTLIKELRLMGVKVGISIKPDTPVEDLAPILKDIDLVLVMSVEPGFGGQSFLRSALHKIEWLDEERKKYKYNYLIEVDGGINAETGALCAEAGADILVAGSYLFGKEDINERIKGLRNG